MNKQYWFMFSNNISLRCSFQTAKAYSAVNNTSWRVLC
ncbi:hypothetical protein [Pantoea phage Nufs112]|nr:hypothetical protein [Pantoea phage Nufs112]